MPLGEDKGKRKNGEADKHKLNVRLEWREKKGTRERGETIWTDREQERVVWEKELKEIRCPCESLWATHLY